MDAALLVLPVLAVEAARTPVRQATKDVLLGFVPFIAWEVFSRIYCWVPVPQHRVCEAEHRHSGSGADETRLVLRPRSRGRRPGHGDVDCGRAGRVGDSRTGEELVRPGSARYCIYVVSVGGDFMRGRFFAAPFFVAIRALDPPGVAKSAGDGARRRGRRAGAGADGPVGATVAE